ncbi:MAG TPA: hypothetical protein DCE42_04640 [Myxococcales bacterium]|nr:hypothetical protein [Deltaproteobacteria bacterium]HAA54016.1 hypothetical protein [Myxococcales bacterium]|tara:strand:- start:6864 stop:7190 length:327 start_codon:yes stop_codon:yes gene_type:complete
MKNDEMIWVEIETKRGEHSSSFRGRLLRKDFELFQRGTFGGEKVCLRDVFWAKELLREQKTSHTIAVTRYGANGEHKHFDDVKLSASEIACVSMLHELDICFLSHPHA